MSIDVAKLYPPNDTDWFDYQPMINAFGNIVVQVDDNNYQGDSRILYDENGKIGVLIFGWGSCSGCDALQACKTIEDAQELCDELQNGIKWFENAHEAYTWFLEHDWEGDWCCNQKELIEFIIRSINYLSKRMEDFSHEHE